MAHPFVYSVNVYWAPMGAETLPGLGGGGRCLGAWPLGFVRAPPPPGVLVFTSRVGSEPLCHPFPPSLGWGRGWGRSRAAPPWDGGGPPWGGGGPGSPARPHTRSCSRNGGFKLFFVGEYACGLNYLYAALISPKCFIGIRRIREREMEAPGARGGGAGAVGEQLGAGGGGRGVP